MNPTPADQSPEEIGPFQFVVLVLSLVVLASLVVDTVADLPAEVSTLLEGIDRVICVVLLVDFLIRFRRAPAKWHFMRWGWIDLLASIPNLEIFRLGRFVRVFRVLRMLRGVRLVHRLVTTIFRSRIQGGLAMVGLTVFLMLSFSSISILILEQGPDATITTAGDAIWWSVATLTTVGYGDLYPVTVEGRILAAILMFSGLGLFGTISGITASLFVGAPSEDQALEPVLEEIRQLRAELRSKKSERVPDTLPAG
jgi:Kef-type K+ transport systems, predicted NAD-binding component